MVWSTPPTFTAGVLVPQAQLQVLSDDLTFLRNTDAVAPVLVTSNSSATSGTTELVLATLGAYTADGSTEIELAFSWYFFGGTVAGEQYIVRLYDGPTAGSGTQLAGCVQITATATSVLIPGDTIRHRYTPAAGSHTYTARVVRNTGTGTVTLNASSTAPALFTLTRTA
jgi:hypothetical protein